MEEFKVGDVVSCVAGGPSMTVEKIDEGKQEAHCVWFDGNSVLHRNKFQLTSLKLSEITLR